jgi:hypothetical protein
LLVLLLLRLELLSSGDETALVSSLRLTVTSSLISTSVSSLLITTSITTLLVAPLLAVITSGLLLLLSVGVVRVCTGLTSLLLLSRLTGLTRTRNKVAAGDELISSRVHFFSRYDPGSMSM